MACEAHEANGQGPFPSYSPRDSWDELLTSLTSTMTPQLEIFIRALSRFVNTSLPAHDRQQCGTELTFL